ncbi:hypothetical protein [Occultella kanbiaonis]|uniref:hypothetical protein n=1 Tax=Occultella kanbiaonis TaxID=2675754 RepID=UPI0013D828FE|nr:hypothetical protein [Occultella kanbiaonis]
MSQRKARATRRLTPEQRATLPQVRSTGGPRDFGPAPSWEVTSHEGRSTTRGIFRTLLGAALFVAVVIGITVVASLPWWTFLAVYGAGVLVVLGVAAVIRWLGRADR